MSAFSKQPDRTHPKDDDVLRARQHHNDRIGSAVKSAKNWRMVAFGCIGVALVSAAGAVAGFTTAETEVIYVSVDDAGRPTDVRLAKTQYTPGERSVSYFLGRFVEEVRSLPRDKMVLQQNWQNAWAYATDSGRAELDRIIQEEEPFKTPEKESRRVKIESIVQQPNSPNTYEIEWIEQRFTPAGEEPSRRFRGLFTIEFMQPQTEDQLAVNPLGIFVTDFSYAPVR